MTDNTPWQSPSGATPPTSQTPASPYAAPTAAPVGPPPAAGGWTPPPKPGLIPLRPLTLGTILGAAFQVLRRNPRPTFGFALLVTGASFVLTLVVVGLVTFFALSRTINATGADAATLEAGSVAMIILGSVATVALSLIGSAILQGVIALEVARATLGEKLRLGGLWRAAKGRIGALIGWAMIVAVVILLALGILAGLVAVVIAFGGQVGLVIGVLLGIVALGGVTVLFAWLGTKLSLVASVLMLERLPLRAAVARSWSLTNGFFWKTLGIQLLVIVIVQVVAGIISTPLSLLFGFASTLINPNNMDQGLIVGAVVLYVLTIVVSLVFGAIAAVVQSATPALIYIDIRMRKEGLDLELSRFVEARQASNVTVENPYLVASTPGAAETPAATSAWS